MVKLMCIADEEYKAFINLDMVCMFRLKTDEDGDVRKSTEVEIQFIGGSKTRLAGESAQHFVSAAIDWMGGI